MSGKDKIASQEATDQSPVSGNNQHQELIQACIAHDRIAQKKMYDLFAPFILGIIRRYTYDLTLADEILNDTFYKIFTALHQYAFKGSIEGWMRRIAINTITDTFRKYVKNEPSHKTDIADIDLYIPGDAAGRLNYKALLELIHTLPKTQRTVFNLFVFEQFSHKEIAEYLGLNENNSRWYLNDARKRLKDKITSSM